MGGKDAPLWLHVKKVVETCEQLAPPANSDREALLLAAYLHDVGYATGSAFEHERRSADMADQFLRDHGVVPARVERVKQIILAHVFPVFGQERDNLSLERAYPIEFPNAPKSAHRNVKPRLDLVARYGRITVHRSPHKGRRGATYSRGTGLL